MEQGREGTVLGINFEFVYYSGKSCNKCIIIYQKVLTVILMKL